MRDRKKFSTTSRLAIACVLLIVVYPLSVGPALWLSSALTLWIVNNYGMHPAVTWIALAQHYFYLPLAFVVQMSREWVHEAIQQYVALWVEM